MWHANVFENENVLFFKYFEKEQEIPYVSTFSFVTCFFCDVIVLEQIVWTVCEKPTQRYIFYIKNG